MKKADEDLLWRKEFVACLLLVLAVFLAYINVYHNPPLLDDKNLIEHNDTLQSLGSLWNHGSDVVGFYRPMQMLLYFFVYQLFGLSFPAFHALNVTLHAINAMLVFRLGCRLGFKTTASFLAALVWAVHPIHTSSIDQMSATATPLACLFLLTGVLVLLPDFSVRKLCWASLLFVCALASKESAVVFPALATGCLFLVSKDRLRVATYFRTGPLWAMAAVFIAGTFIYYGIHTNLVLYDPDDTVWMQDYMHNVTNRILTCLATLPAYAELFLWPSKLYVDHDRVITTTLDAKALAGLLMAVAVIAQIIYGQARLCRNKNSSEAGRTLALSWGFLWFIAAQSPNTGILIPVNGVMEEGWMYVPSIGLFLGLAQTAALYLDKLKMKQLPAAACALAVLVALTLGVRTYFQNEVWSDGIRFFENTLASGSHSGRAHVILAMLDAYEGRFDEAIANEQAAISHPSPLKIKDMPGLHFDLALMYMHARPESTDTGIITTEDARRALSPASQIPEAIAELKKVQQTSPEMAAMAGKYLAVIYDYQSRGGTASLYETWAARKAAQ